MTAEIRLDGDATFTLTADTGDLEWQARRLVASIRREVPDATIVTFIPESSAPLMDELAFFESETTVVLGDLPMSEYPISAFLQAFVEGTRRSTTEFVVALDTDTIVLDELVLPNVDADLWVRPAEVGAQYWGSPRANRDWETLYTHFGVPRPTEREHVETVIDRRTINPYWNSGVVITRDHSLATEWLDVTRELATASSLPIADDEFFLDQIALAIVSRTRDIHQFDVRLNYPLGGMATVPDDVRILHYGNTRNLGRVYNPVVRRKLRRLDALPPMTPADFVRSGLDLLSFNSGRLLSYDRKQTVRRIARCVLPRSIRNP